MDWGITLKRRVYNGLNITWRISRIYVYILESRKYVTNGSKTAVTDVIGFLFVILRSRTVQLHNSVGRRRACSCLEAGFSSQNGDRAWGVYCRKTAFCCAFYRQNDAMQKMFIKKCFLFTGGSVCRVKRFTAGSRNSLKAVRKWQIMSYQMRKWLRQQPRDF
jgi:hypothetical protein